MFGISIQTLLIRVLILLVAQPVHEWAHAWSAYQLGDDTASLQGRMTLNPVAHFDPIGSLLLVLQGFGWGKPVPINPYRMRVPPRIGAAISAVAGPFSNFLLAMLLAIPFRLNLVGWGGQALGGISLSMILLVAIRLNLGLMLFNLLPVYPLDGEKALVGVLPMRWGDAILSMRPYGPIVLAALLFVLPMIGIDVVGTVVGPVYRFLINLLLYS